MVDRAPFRTHSSHWGAFSAAWQDGELLVRPHANDPDPSALLGNFTDTLRHKARIGRPMVREGWLKHGPAPAADRGRDRFIPMEWDEVLDRLGAELARVRDTHGPGAIFGGSYGWSSAGRFHHAQSQVHRFLNTALGGYVRSVGSYSAGAATFLLPRILGPFTDVTRRNVTWDQIVEHTDTVVAFGGLPLRNMAVSSGGVSRHIERDAIAAAHARGCRFINVSPLRCDLHAGSGAEWLPITPGTDTALILALIHTLVAENLHDQVFLATHCAGWDRFAEYVSGGADGVAKSAAWAGPIAGIGADDIVALARRMAQGRTLVSVAHALQRAEHGEQPIWAASVLAAVLGQIGLPGGGYNYALGTIAHYGRRGVAAPIPTLPQGRNRVPDLIPCARIADMLLNPGAAFDFDGKQMRYADIRLVYWAGGNPFHHHQDLNRLRRAFARPETIVVHESVWTSTARHADIVLPCTTTLERDDIGGAANDPLLVAMQRVAPPFGESRDDYAIFSGLARRLGAEEAFTEGRDVEAWLRHLYADTRRAMGLGAPDFDTFWQAGEVEMPLNPDDGGVLRAFRLDPAGAPLATPSGKIEIVSDTIGGFGYDDCPAHPTWLDRVEVPSGDAPLWLVANQPATRLHSQLDFGAHSQAHKRRGREVATLHPVDAAARGIADGDIIRLHNSRGACLAAACISDGIKQGVVQLPTGAWYDPDDAQSESALCVHGNPNVLTRDAGTSRLTQGCTGQLCAIQVERFTGNLPPIRAYDPPG